MLWLPAAVSLQGVAPARAIRRTVVDTDDDESTHVSTTAPHASVLPPSITSGGHSVDGIHGNQTRRASAGDTEGFDNVAFVLLDQLDVSVGILEPAFRPDVLLYTLCVPTEITEVNQMGERLC